MHHSFQAARLHLQSLNRCKIPSTEAIRIMIESFLTFMEHDKVPHYLLRCAWAPYSAHTCCNALRTEFLIALQHFVHAISAKVMVKVGNNWLPFNRENGAVRMSLAVTPKEFPTHIEYELLFKVCTSLPTTSACQFRMCSLFYVAKYTQLL